MSKQRKIAATAVPPGTGTYTPAIRAGDFLFLTGQTGFSPQTGKLAEDLEGQTRTMLENVDKLLSASGCSREDIVQVKLIFTDIVDFKAVDQMYAQWLPDRGEAPYPARTAFQAAALPAGARVMMEVVALFPG
jgi:2-iminobutanoate/2-iminopropanoate deaminase